LWVKIQERGVVREAAGLHVRGREPGRVRMNERLPSRPPRGRAAEGSRVACFDWMTFRANVQTRAADKAEARVVEMIVGPIVHGCSLRGGPVPEVDVEREERADRVVPVRKIMPADLAMVVRQPVPVTGRFR